MSNPTWKDSLKRSALESLTRIGSDVLTPARELLDALEKAGHVVRLAPGDSIEVTPRVTPDFAGRIRQLKAELVAVLRDAPTSLGWTVADVSVHVSLSSNAISDFVLAPEVEGCGAIEIPAAIRNALLAGASPEWRARVKGIGKLCAYSLSQFAAARPKLELALTQKKAS